MTATLNLADVAGRLSLSVLTIRNVLTHFDKAEDMSLRTENVGSMSLEDALDALANIEAVVADLPQSESRKIADVTPVAVLSTELLYSFATVREADEEARAELRAEIAALRRLNREAPTTAEAPQGNRPGPESRRALQMAVRRSVAALAKRRSASTDIAPGSRTDGSRHEL